MKSCILKIDIYNFFEERFRYMYAERKKAKIMSSNRIRKYEQKIPYLDYFR